MELTFAQQSLAFLWSIALGAAYGVIYGAVKILRLALRFGRAVCIAADIAFMLLCSLGMFLFMLAFISGFVRLYPIFGAALGFFAYRMTVGRLLERIYCPLIEICSAAFKYIFAHLKLFAKNLLKIARKILYNIKVIIKAKCFDRPGRSASCERRVDGYEKKQNNRYKRSGSKRCSNAKHGG